MSRSVVFKEFDSLSEVWKHFLRAEDGHSAKCKLCPNILKISHCSTKGLHTHLRAIHNINLHEDNAERDIPSEERSALQVEVSAKKKEAYRLFSG